MKKYTMKTRHALLMSLISLMTCFAMLLGSTFAWFTDSVTSGVNRIVAGNLDVELTHQSTGTAAEEPVASNTQLFKAAYVDNTASANYQLWEPGAVTYEKFTVKNVGNLALKYKMTLNIGGYNTVGGKSLEDVVKVAVTNTEPASRDDATALTFAKLSDFTKEGTLAAKTDDSPFYVVLYWAPSTNDVDNIYNLNNGRKADDGSDQLYIDLGVNLQATQQTSESDSFDNQYDVNADYPVTMTQISTTTASNAFTSASTVATELTSGKVAASVPATTTIYSSTDTSTAIATDTNTTLALTVDPKDDAADASITITGSDVANCDTVDYYDIKLEATTTDGTTSTTTEVKSTSNIITVTLNLGKGLSNVHVNHAGADMTEATSGAANTYSYDATTGILTLYLNSFSPFAIGYDAPVALYKNVYYATLGEAYDAALANNGGEIKLLRDASGKGIGRDGDAGVTYSIDFGGHTYTCVGPAVGSKGTETQAFRVINGQKVTLKNGTFTCTSNAGVYMLFHIYDDMTLENMVIDGSNMPGNGLYTLSYCLGNSVIKGNTVIKVVSNGTAFDVDGGYANNHSSTVAVTFADDFTGKVNGIVEYNYKAAGKSTLTIGGNGDFTNASITDNSGEETPAITITGGTFNSDPTAYVDTTKYMVKMVKADDATNPTSWTVKGMSDIAKAFAEAAGATNIEVGSNYASGTMTDNVKYTWYADGGVYVADATNFAGETYTVPKFVTGLGDSSFKYNTSIKTLKITGNITSAYKALQGNSKITTVDFGSKMTSIPNRMFYGCTGITELVIPECVTRIEDWGFYANTTIEKIVVPESVTYIGYKAFDGCRALRVLDIKGSPAIMNRACRSCTSLTTVYIRGASATVDKTYSRQDIGNDNVAEDYVFCKNQSCNPNVNSGMTIYVASESVKGYFDKEVYAGSILNIMSAPESFMVN